MTTSWSGSTENTITDWDDLLHELEQTRARGVAFDREESDIGIAGIGAVIIGGRGEPVGAYAAAMPVARFDDAIELGVDGHARRPATTRRERSGIAASTRPRTALATSQPDEAVRLPLVDHPARNLDESSCASD